MCKECQEKAAAIVDRMDDAKMETILGGQEDLAIVIEAIIYSLMEEGVRLNNEDINAIGGTLRLAFVLGYEYGTEVWRDY